MDPQQAKYILSIYESGKSAFNNCDYSLAKKCFANCIELDPKEDQFYLELAKTQSKLKAHESAIESLKQCLLIDPKNIVALMTLSEEYSLLGQSEVGIWVLYRVLEIQHDPLIILSLACEYQKLKMYTRSIIETNKVLKKQEKSGYPNKYLTKVGLEIRSWAYFWLKMYKEALNDFNLVLEIEPVNLINLHGKSKCHFYLNNFEEAINSLSILIDNDPKNTELYHFRGMSYYSRNLFNKCMLDYNTALSLDTNQPDFYYNRALCFDQLGLFSNAISDFKQALLLEKNNIRCVLRIVQMLNKMGAHPHDLFLILFGCKRKEPHNPELLFVLGAWYSLYKKPLKQCLFEHSKELLPLIDSSFEFEFHESNELINETSIIENQNKLSEYYYLESIKYSIEFFHLNTPVNKIIVYQYLGCNYNTINSLMNNYFFFSNPQLFGDALDTPFLSKDENWKNSFNNLIDKIGTENIRIRCFCMTPPEKDSESMWQNFASGGAGICIKFSIDYQWTKKNNILFQKVSYSKSNEPSTDSPHEYTIQSFFTKHSSFGNENELRFLSFGKFGNPHGEKYSYSLGNDVKIEHVYFGPNCPTEFSEEVIKTIQFTKSKFSFLNVTEENSFKLKQITPPKVKLAAKAVAKL